MGPVIEVVSITKGGLQAYSTFVQRKAVCMIYTYMCIQDNTFALETTAVTIGNGVVTTSGWTNLRYSGSRMTWKIKTKHTYQSKLNSISA